MKKTTTKTRMRTFEQWKNELDDGEIEFILEDYFCSHPSYDEKTRKLVEHYTTPKED